jgi:isoleucyl-tRNA synthetase
MVYWGDDEQQQRAERLKRLRKKKGGEEVEITELAQLDSGNAEIINLLQQQNAEIRRLTDTVVNQQESLRELKDKINTEKVVREVVVTESPVSVEKVEPKKQLITKLDDIDVNVIETTEDMEIRTGAAGGSKVKGTSNKEKLARLKQIKRGKK